MRTGSRNQTVSIQIETQMVPKLSNATYNCRDDAGKVWQGHTMMLHTISSNQNLFPATLGMLGEGPACLPGLCLNWGMSSVFSGQVICLNTDGEADTELGTPKICIIIYPSLIHLALAHLIACVHVLQEMMDTLNQVKNKSCGSFCLPHICQEI